MLGYGSPPFGDEASLSSPPACEGLNTGETPRNTHYMLTCPFITTFVTLRTVISWSTLYKKMGPHQRAAIQT